MIIIRILETDTVIYYSKGKRIIMSKQIQKIEIIMSLFKMLFLEKRERERVRDIYLYREDI